METCVKNGHHEEALSIQQLCAKLHKPLGNVPLVRYFIYFFVILYGVTRI